MLAVKNFLPRWFKLQIFDDLIGIILKNTRHLGKKFLASISSAIVYWPKAYGADEMIERYTTKSQFGSLAIEFSE